MSMRNDRKRTVYDSNYPAAKRTRTEEFHENAPSFQRYSQHSSLHGPCSSKSFSGNTSETSPLYYKPFSTSKHKHPQIKRSSETAVVPYAIHHTPRCNTHTFSGGLPANTMHREMVADSAERQPPPKRQRFRSTSLKDHDRTDYVMFVEKLIKMESMDSSSVIPLKLPVHKFVSILNSLSIFSTKLVLLLVKLLIKISTGLSSKVDTLSLYHLQLFQSPQRATFFQCISTYISSMPQEGNEKKRKVFAFNLSDIIKLFKELLKTQPYNAVVCLPIDACYGTLEQLCQQDFLFKDIQEDIALFKVKRDEIRHQLYQSSYTSQICSEESDLPTQEELQQNLITTLRKNIIKGPFLDTSEYLDIFRDLMQQDFFEPLRETLKEIKIKGNCKFVYEDVHLKCCAGVTIATESILCRLRFKPIKKNVNWASSKRLTYGNLLCLSEDNFNTLVFATIAERNIDDLSEHELTISLIGRAAQDASYTSPERVYKMFESPSYYEAYAPIMKRLRSISKEQNLLPFQKYLVKVDTKIEKPFYLRNQDCTLDLRGIVCSCPKKVCDHSSIEVDEIQQERLENVEALDQSQVKALCVALTKELVLIQGPPGTGKTYIGLKIVQSLLINKSVWQSSENVPIMIVCYTNHALDQFLEGLIKIKEEALPQDSVYNVEIRRLGGRSKSEKLEPYNIKKFVGMACRRNGIRLNSQKKLLVTRKRLHNNPFHDEVEANRQVFFDDEPENFQENVYEQASMANFVEFFSKVYPLSEKRANELLENKGTTIETFVHFQLFKYCLRELRDAWHSKADQIADQNEENSKRLELIRIKCLQEADIIGMTTTGAAKYNTTLSQVKSKICVIEEAAEVFEPHVISTLTSHTEHLILIGDHKQLQPRANSYSVGRDFKLEVSLFERLANNDFPVVTLGVQHRMRPEISQLVSKYVYDGKLTDSPKVHNYENVRGVQVNTFFIDHKQPETQDEENASPSNFHEADFIVYLSVYFIQNGYKPEEITILTPYLGQMFVIRYHLKLPNGIRVSTLDNYQGEENKIILLSMVRSNEQQYVGFTKKDNRVCVALSRAKVGFYCIGDFSMYKKKSRLWMSVIKDLEARQRLGEKLPLQCATHQDVTMVACAQDFANVPEGGCDKICGSRFLRCDHLCNRKCHPTDLAHDFPCNQPCSKRCTKDLHRCQGKCGEECPPCEERVEKVIPRCEHSQQVPCYKPAADFSCEMKCDKSLSSCGHPCKLTCGEDCNSKPCRMFVKKLWPCGHEAQKECHVTELEYSHACNFPCEATLACSHKCGGKCGRCHQGRLHLPCNEKCGRQLICGHTCSEKCSKNCPPCEKACPFICVHGRCGHRCSTLCKPCPYSCEWKCEHYQCTRNCGEMCDRPVCNGPCKLKLPNCGHDCIGLCGEPCPSVCRICDKDSHVFEVNFGPEDEPNSRFITLVDCGHIFEVKSLDKFFGGTKSFAVDWLKCPKCSSYVFNTYRYANRIKEMKNAINVVKTQNLRFLTVVDRKDYCDIVRRKRNEAAAILDSEEFTYIKFPKSLRDSLTRWLSKVEKANHELVSDAILECTYMLVQYILEVLERIETLNECSTVDEPLNTMIKVLLAQAVQFLQWIVSNLQRQPFTDQMYDDLTSEWRRINLLGELYVYQIYNNCIENSLLEQILQYECKIGYECKRLTQQVFEEKFAELQEHFAHTGLIIVPSRRERAMIVRALHSKLGSWYKCENGHIYNIDGCGGAVEKAKCPDCLADIGGDHYELVSGNTIARKFDDFDM